MERASPLPRLGMLATVSQQRLNVLRHYADALRDNGAEVIPVVLEEVDLEHALDGLDGLMVPGGRPIHPSLYGGQDEDEQWWFRSKPEADRAEAAIIRQALDRGLPMLGICKGIQMINVAAGGTLHCDLEAQPREPAIAHDQKKISYDDVAPSHAVVIEPSTVLADLFGAGSHDVNSSHRQSVKDVAPDFTVTARAPDGIIEGIERRGHPNQWAIQFHPEKQRRLDPTWNRVFQKLVTDANEWRLQHATIAQPAAQ
jgi:putative glutamine amidotransferase